MLITRAVTHCCCHIHFRLADSPANPERKPCIYYNRPVCNGTACIRETLLHTTPKHVSVPESHNQARADYSASPVFPHCKPVRNARHSGIDIKIRYVAVV